ncbi:MAG: hypothetical protein EZS28_009614 [Streblomastix strix]|uniref:XMAP215/Dis1/CLASP TOG domain-containing protein n=1 Tax=Streblomastix strix TaxID=222440 RepID=A0A5J4WIN4_9EUKA|nr:MAG: hypothetical protein EZS28_009614 [Streblomastix strix]
MTEQNKSQLKDQLISSESNVRRDAYQALRVKILESSNSTEEADKYIQFLPHIVQEMSSDAQIEALECADILLNHAKFKKSQIDFVEISQQIISAFLSGKDKEIFEKANNILHTLIYLGNGSAVIFALERLAKGEEDDQVAALKTLNLALQTFGKTPLKTEIILDILTSKRICQSSSEIVIDEAKNLFKELIKWIPEKFNSLIRKKLQKLIPPDFSITQTKETKEPIPQRLVKTEETKLEMRKKMQDDLEKSKQELETSNKKQKQNDLDEEQIDNKQKQQKRRVKRKAYNRKKQNEFGTTESDTLTSCEDIFTCSTEEEEISMIKQNEQVQQDEVDLIVSVPSPSQLL